MGSAPWAFCSRKRWGIVTAPNAYTSASSTWCPRAVGRTFCSAVNSTQTMRNNTKGSQEISLQGFAAYAAWSGSGVCCGCEQVQDVRSQDPAARGQGRDVKTHRQMLQCLENNKMQ